MKVMVLLDLQYHFLPVVLALLTLTPQPVRTPPIPSPHPNLSPCLIFPVCPTHFASIFPKALITLQQFLYFFHCVYAIGVKVPKNSCQVLKTVAIPMQLPQCPPEIFLGK